MTPSPSHSKPKPNERKSAGLSYSGDLTLTAHNDRITKNVLNTYFKMSHIDSLTRNTGLFKNFTSLNDVLILTQPIWAFKQ